MTADELINKGETLQKELLYAENFDYELEKLLNNISEQRELVYAKAKDIFGVRKKKSKELELKINNLFKDLGLENSEFKADIQINIGGEDDLLSIKNGKEVVKLGSAGYNEIEFLIRTNKGSEFTPLRKSASGGEISRIMLAIKTVLSEKDKVGILVFDEIDAGISGRIAQKAGKVLKELSKTHQIICITHLPQIAAMSDRHFHVNKKTDCNETLASITLLNDDEKINEVAKLISGEKITETAIKNAAELINN